MGQNPTAVDTRRLPHQERGSHRQPVWQAERLGVGRGCVDHLIAKLQSHVE